jgi:hypothetical protein
MINVDVVILSKATNNVLITNTINCVDSLIKSDPSINFKILVIESSNYPWNELSTKVKIINTDIPFNYNKFMNDGLKLGNSEWCLICNNDLEFKAHAILKMIQYNYDSMSPKCPLTATQKHFNGVHKGIRTAKELSGWCILIKRKTFEQIGGLDEDFSFWFADDSYMMQLLQHNIDHYLIATSEVLHLCGGSSTLKTLNKSTIDAYTTKCIKTFNEKYKRNKFGLNPEYDINESKFK